MLEDISPHIQEIRTTTMKIPEDSSGKHSGSGSSITSSVIGLASDLSDKGSTHILESVLEFDVLGNGDAVLGDLGGTEGLIQDGVSALGSQSDLHSIRQQVNTLEHQGTALDTEFHHFAGGQTGRRSDDILSTDFSSKREHID
jgi:hypothetical protein